MLPLETPAFANPIFIALHAGIARVLHMSGAGEVLDQIIDRYDKQGGSSGLRNMARVQSTKFPP